MEKTLNQWTYRRLKEDIMTFVLPPGEAVSAARVAERYQVSRTPAREAIVKLDQEGLVEIYPQSGTFVSRIDLDRTRQEWFVRFALETGLAGAFMERRTGETVRAMEENLRQMELAMESGDKSRCLRLDNAFHDMICDTAGEFLAGEILRSQITHYSRIRYLANLSPGAWEQTADEHRLLLLAARDGDAPLFKERLKAHIEWPAEDQERIAERYPQYFAARGR